MDRAGFRTAGAVLSAAGLVVGTRAGRVVLYQQTDTGRRLAGSTACERPRSRQATTDGRPIGH